ncbi:LrgB family protein [Pseudomonas saliphila]|uniref:LrgB family protein n=1 Tax=Pseudomonas saliphila TaxID=2586906 RepID=UPI00123A6C5A|nr:LrgB family protein [Pseudomonas saliphila]
MSGSTQAALQAVIEHPLFLIGVTLAAYQTGLALYERSRLAIFHPIIVSVPIILVVLWALGFDYPTYYEAVLPLTILLGPTTVALAVPLYLNLRRIRQFLKPVVVTLVLGGLFATLSTFLIGWLMGAEPMILMTMAPKSLTTPIAMLVAEEIGGVVALAAVFVMITAVLGALLGPWLLRLFHITHPAAWGIAMGIVAHAVGTSRAMEEGEEAGAFAALGMSMMGLGSAVLLPLGVTLWTLWF